MPLVPDYAEVNYGAVALPLAGATTTDLMRDADPALFYALDFFRFVLNWSVGERLVAVAEEAGVSLQNAVADPDGTTGVDPGDFLGESPKFRFPLLAIWRQRSKFSRKTAGWHHKTATWGIAWVLPAMNVDAWEKLAPIFNAGENAITAYCDQGWHPEYTPPRGTVGEVVWQSIYAGIEKIGVSEETPTEWGRYAESANGLFYPSWTGELTVLERRMPATGRDKFSGASLNVQIEALDGTKVDLYAMKVAPPPRTIDMIPKSGSSAGGTAISVSGRDFRTGAKVTLGSVACTSVVVVSPTLLTAVTGARAAGLADLVVTNPDEQSSALVEAFTFT